MWAQRRLQAGAAARGPRARHPRDDGPLGNLVTALHQQFGDGTGARGRHIHGGLVSLQGDERRFNFDAVTHLDQYIHDGHGIEVADIRHDQINGAHLRYRLEQAARLGENLRKIGRELRGQRAIDDAMIV